MTAYSAATHAITPRTLATRLAGAKYSEDYDGILRESLAQADDPKHGGDTPLRIGFIGFVFQSLAFATDKTIITDAGNMAWRQLTAAPKTMPEAYAALYLQYATYGSREISAAVGWEALRCAASISAHPAERKLLLPIAESQFEANSQAWLVARQMSLRNETLLHSGDSLASAFTDQARKAQVLLAEQGHAVIKRAQAATLA